ncbi:N-acetyltransferase DgcN [Lacibacterium aquatile]|uniref:N-acetyltransferase DgcN n=1 Tax=Lacibacterium aquatile TaxID=1168082 RepID=A0ABW5DY86_9PROT
MELQRPYQLFLGDVKDRLAAKTAQGIAQWRPELCIGQTRMAGCEADLGLPDLSLKEAYEKDARTLIIGIANRGGTLSEKWVPLLIEALTIGFDLASGLHMRLGDHPDIWEAATNTGRRLIDIRHCGKQFEVANGIKRSGRRLLTVGTDCSVGKMYTTLALEREMQERGLKVTFRATGQTGIFIAGSGVPVDAIVSDFVAGAVEHLTPAGEADHWDLIEGQGSLYHASYAGVSLGLLHGAQPDALVLCHEPGRPHMRGLQQFPLPSLEACIATNLAMARLTNPAVKCVGISFNTQNLPEVEAKRLIAETEERLGLPVVDPLATGVGAIVDKLMVTA